MTFAQKIATLPDVPSDLVSHLERYRDLLLQWNKIHNLSGYKDAATIEYYLYDALYPITFLPPVATAMDIGTGAGFPGLILAMAQPQTHWTLVEPLQKRAGFLQFVKATLKLENVTVENCRVEALEPQRFDLITSRAVTDTGMLLNLSAPYRDAETMLLFYKGENVYNEVPEELPYRIIETDERHYLLINPPKETACS
ncbi:16S rRNA (guanine(527)-N(7))-methyltransferase RsmG [Sulfurimonas sp. HSL1-2]|uniref:16S rRNA (guanine(527)-N(7))-methyltransferase RsmG n=1 Tax=Thiomicrolovo zhangzhouensis TaxID=3131933 RepID=UPI0031F8A90F